MIKLVVLWNSPEDMTPEEFDRRYFEEHVSLVRSIPGLRRYLTTKFVGTPSGAPAPYYRMAELYYDDMEALRRGRSSPQSQAAQRQIVDWKWRDVHTVMGEEIQQPLAGTE